MDSLQWISNTQIQVDSQVGVDPCIRWVFICLQNNRSTCQCRCRPWVGYCCPTSIQEKLILIIEGLQDAPITVVQIAWWTKCGPLMWNAGFLMQYWVTPHMTTGRSSWLGCWLRTRLDAIRAKLAIRNQVVETKRTMTREHTFSEMDRIRSL